LALENIYDARWFINWVEVQNLSSHATVAKGSRTSGLRINIVDLSCAV
jgi:hypothetical protein